MNKNESRQFILFLLASAVLGIFQSVDTSFFNNYLNDTFQLTINQRTYLEIPREFPGFAVVFITGLLFSLGDVRIAMIANLLGGIGALGLAFFAPQYGIMVAWLLIYSMGQHLFMPISNSIGMSLGSEADMGKRLGWLNSANTAVFLATSLLIAFIFHFIKIDYHIAFAISAVSFFLAAFFLFLMKPVSVKRSGKKFFFRRRYLLFYALSAVYGARKQIFITFGPWVLIKIFNQGVSTFALLSFLIAGLGIFFKPFIGHLIDTAGEKIILAGEAIVLIFVCLGYALSKQITEYTGYGEYALILICIFYVLDQMLNAVSMARATYLRKIALTPEDVSPTLSMGISIDHVVSMFIPWLGGFIWFMYGYEYVFVGGACIALLNLLLTNRIHMEQKKAAAD